MKKFFSTSLVLVVLSLPFKSYSNHSIVQAYTGRIHCATIDQDVANFSELQVGRFCRNASDACAVQNMYHKLDKKNPLWAILNNRLQDYLNLQLEICELAFAVNAPEYYERNLSRTKNFNTLPSAAFDRTIAITPTYVE